MCPNYKYPLFFALTMVILPGCSWLTAYKMDIRQGNYETVEMVDRVKEGMTKDQVRFSMGTPLLMDTFHTDRWDYVYRFHRGNQDQAEGTRQTVSVFFDEEGLVNKIEVRDSVAAEEKPVSFQLNPSSDGSKKTAESALEQTPGAIQNREEPALITTDTQVLAEPIAEPAVYDDDGNLPRSSDLVNEAAESLQRTTETVEPRGGAETVDDASYDVSTSSENIEYHAMDRLNPTEPLYREAVSVETVPAITVPSLEEENPAI